MAQKPSALSGPYNDFLTGVGSLLEAARKRAAGAVNAVLTATYWEIGRRIVMFEQNGKGRAGYGEVLLKRLSHDLSAKFGRGFSKYNLVYMRRFYLDYMNGPIGRTLSYQSNSPICQTPSGKLEAPSFPLSWSHYILLLSVDDRQARAFYETEAEKGAWSVRQLERQIDSQFYQRTTLAKRHIAPSPDRFAPEDEIKDPLVLEFLDLKDEYSESELEEALIRRLEWFLLEMGGEFAFIARQKRLRVGDSWYRIDLMLYHRRLRCLVLVDLKLGRFTHEDAGQMHLYLNYTREHWTLPGENPPVGLILCARKDQAVAHYALDGLPNKILASEYRTVLPETSKLEAEMRKTQAALRRQARKGDW